MPLPWPVTVRPAEPSRYAGPAGSRLGEDDDEERDRPEDRRAVDEHEQDQDDRAGDRQQRHVEALEHAADVGRERRAARHRDLQAVTAALVAADPLAQARYGLVGRVVARVAQRDGEQRRVARELRLADADGERRRVALERAPVVPDPRAVLLGQSARAPVDGDRRRHLVAELLGRAHHLERFGAVGQRRGEIRARDVAELPALGGQPAGQEHERDRGDELGAAPRDELHRPLDHFPRPARRCRGSSLAAGRPRGHWSGRWSPRPPRRQLHRACAGRHGHGPGMPAPARAARARAGRGARRPRMQAGRSFHPPGGSRPSARGRPAARRHRLAL